MFDQRQTSPVIRNQRSNLMLRVPEILTSQQASASLRFANAQVAALAAHMEAHRSLPAARGPAARGVLDAVIRAAPISATPAAALLAIARPAPAARGAVGSSRRRGHHRGSSEGASPAAPAINERPAAAPRGRLELEWC